MTPRIGIKLLAVAALAVVVVTWNRAAKRVDETLGPGTWAKAKLQWKLQTLRTQLFT